MAKLKKLILQTFLFSSFFILNSMPSVADEGSKHALRIGYQNSPPYQYIGNDGVPEGIGVDIIRAASENLGLELEWVYSPNSPDLHFQNGDVDLWPIVTDIPYRHDYFYITKPIYQNSLGIISRAELPIVELKDVKDKRIAFYNREPGISLVKKLFPSSIHVPMDSNADTIAAVFMDKPVADAAFVWSTKANSILFKKEIEKHAEIPFSFYFFEEEKITCGIGASKNNRMARKAADRLREEIRKLATNGQVQEIYFKYYLDPENEISSYFYVHNLERRNLVLASALTTLVIALMLLYYLTLRLKKSERSAQLANQAKSLFLANMSHEIRTPLNGILNTTELALTTELTSTQNDLIKTAQQSAEALTKVVNDILDFSSVEAGKLRISYETISLRDIVDSSVEFFSPMAQEKELFLSAEYEEGSPNYIKGDRARIRQILYNLVGNAIKYTNQGSVKVVVKNNEKDTPGFLKIEVTDTGIGIAEAYQESVFGSFQQIDNSNARKYEGTGLGLAICKQLLEKMKGSIDLSSEMGKGSKFAIQLPLELAEAPKEETQQEAEAFDQHPDEASTLNVLIVDDNPVNLKIGKTVIERYGHKVTLAQSGKIALSKLENTKFDLILMDIQMPDLDGYQTTRRIRDLEKRLNTYTPIIALTACVLNNEEFLCLQAGMDAYLSKPLRVKTMLKKIEEVTLALSAQN